MKNCQSGGKILHSAVIERPVIALLIVWIVEVAGAPAIFKRYVLKSHIESHWTSHWTASQYLQALLCWFLQACIRTEANNISYSKRYATQIIRISIHIKGVLTYWLTDDAQPKPLKLQTFGGNILWMPRGCTKEFF